MTKYVCFSCSGWGHTKTCFRKTKDKSRVGGCPTGDLIDSTYKVGGIDKAKWKYFENLEKPPVERVLNFPPITAEASTDGTTVYLTKRPPSTKIDHTAFKTYFGHLPVPEAPAQRQQPGQPPAQPVQPPAQPVQQPAQPVKPSAQTGQRQQQEDELMITRGKDKVK
jgi:hypothetical protein